jgi:hypothetical protein
MEMIWEINWRSILIEDFSSTNFFHSSLRYFYGYLLAYIDLYRCDCVYITVLEEVIAFDGRIVVYRGKLGLTPHRNILWN